jgi:alkanesulfonate monooxygenase SsuD/methylene tetrahydromethanopterin reductase-like flavin-dependent oxidoreductase (luciferase family)
MTAVDPARLRFGAAFWIQKTDWPEIRAWGLAAEDAGFDSLWVDDHLLSDEGDPDDPKLEGWTTLAALAASTTRPRLGHLVLANTLREPGLVAKLAVTLDDISGGRAVLGIGAGWFAREHQAFGLDFGASAGERIDRLAESAAILRRLLDGERVTHAGRFYRLDRAVARPGPHGAGIPILVGGMGRRKTLRVVAESADIWNGFGTAAVIADASATLDAHCAAIGRDPASVVRTAALNVVVRPTRREAEDEFDRVRARHVIQPDEKRLHLWGPPAAVAAGLRAYAAAGVSETMWIFRHPWDRETIAALPAVRAALAG